MIEILHSEGPFYFLKFFLSFFLPLAPLAEPSKMLVYIGGDTSVPN